MGSVVLSRVWGVMAPKVRVVTCLGRLGFQKRGVFVPLGNSGPQKAACFLEPGAVDLQKVVSNPVWDHWFRASGHPSEGQSNFILNLDQKPDKLKSTEKQKTDQLHWVSHCGGLGEPHYEK